jgi:NADH-quinone oxidoreductase subunit M
VTNDKNKSLADLVPREWLVIVPIIAMTVVMGVLPNLFLRPMEPSVNRLLSHIRQRSGQEYRARLDKEEGRRLVLP